jgi:hypothetical protein
MVSARELRLRSRNSLFFRNAQRSNRAMSYNINNHSQQLCYKQAMSFTTRARLSSLHAAPLHPVSFAGAGDLRQRPAFRRLEQMIPPGMRGAFELLVDEHGHIRALAVKVDAVMDGFAALSAEPPQGGMAGFRHHGREPVFIADNLEQLLHALPAGAPAEAVSHLRRSKTSPDVAQWYARMDKDQRAAHAPQASYHASYRLDAAPALPATEQALLKTLRHTIPAEMHSLYTLDIGRTSQGESQIMALVLDPHVAISHINRITGQHEPEHGIGPHPVNPLHLSRQQLQTLQYAAPAVRSAEQREHHSR